MSRSIGGRVLKFGGSCLGERLAINRCVDRIDHHLRQSKQAVHIVASAPRGLTSALLAIMHTDIRRPRLRYLQDKLTSAGIVGFTGGELEGMELVRQGECASIETMAWYLSRRGLQVCIVPTDELITTGVDGSVHLQESYEQLNRQLDLLWSPSIQVYIHMGFFATNVTGKLTTLGRGGGDYTATIIGRAICSERVTLYKAECGLDSDGFSTGLSSMDIQSKWSGIIEDGRTKDTLRRHEVKRLHEQGRSVIHPTAMNPLVGTTIPVHVANLCYDGKVTIIL
jgi:aspartate kinase